MARTRWDSTSIPDQAGRIAVVTGANSGLGYMSARGLARAGARVVLACRDRERGEAALRRLRDDAPGSDAELRSLDLASLASVREFAAGIRSSYDHLDLLINNAGVMAVPRSATTDGFERQFATNHLGHFALTGLLLPLLLDQAGARVVTVSSDAHKGGRIDLTDLQHERRYGRWRAYAASKLANLLFAYQLQRRLVDAGSPAISVAAHPGTAATNLVVPTAGSNPVKRVILGVGIRLVGQSDEMGALPQLYAATALDVHGGQYYGPNSFGGTRGYPTLTASTGRSYDEELARRLWDASIELTGVGYDALSAA